MADKSPERIGVIVVHGVGDAREGWIDTELVPNLQRWSAYASLGTRPPSDSDRDMVLVARCKDLRHIAIALDSDASFTAFCKSTGRDDLASIAEFKTAELRRSNRDKLAEIVAALIARASAHEWLTTFAAGNVPAALAFEPYSRVHRVRDPESRDPARTWKSFSRTWPLDGKEILFTELFWADMSNVGRNIFSRFISTLELVLEAPFFLGRALLRDSTGGMSRVIRSLVQTTNWLMRWLVAGLNTSIFITALLAIVLKPFVSKDWLATGLAGLLAAIALAGIQVCRKQVHSRPGLADLGLATSLCSLALLAVLGIAKLVVGGNLPDDPTFYLVSSILLLLAAWTLWTIPIILAIVLVMLVGLKRLVWRWGAQTPPMRRAAAAIGLNLLLAIIVKFFFAAFGILVVAALIAPENQPIAMLCKNDLARSSEPWWQDWGFFLNAKSACSLAELKQTLLYIAGFNALSIASLLLTGVLLGSYREGKKGIFRKAAREGRLHLPRLIANPLIIAMLFAGALFNAAVIYIPIVSDYVVPEAVASRITSSGNEPYGAGAMIAFIIVMAAVIEMSGAALHIGRDLVDHQYDRNPRSLAVRIAGSLPDPDAEADAGRKRYRRRLRIQRRLEALIEEVIARQRADRLVFLAHSQGTVITRDYLLDHDKLIASRSAQDRSISTVRRIDVITLGSPLTHLYQHYFSGDGVLDDATHRGARQFEKVRSWTNIWRIDDPIGQEVRFDADVPIANKGIGPGGHTSYWKEPDVCATIMRMLLEPPDAPPLASTLPPAAARRPMPAV